MRMLTTRTKVDRMLWKLNLKVEREKKRENSFVNILVRAVITTESGSCRAKLIGGGGQPSLLGDTQQIGMEIICHENIWILSRLGPWYIFAIMWILDPRISYFCLSCDLLWQVATVKSQMPALECQNNIILIIIISMSNNKNTYFSLLRVHQDCISR